MLVAGSLSKTYAMTGWRHRLRPGARSHRFGAMTKLQQSHSTSNPTSISQKAAVEALLHGTPQESVGRMLAEYHKRRDFVLNRLSQIPGVKCAVPQGAFYVYPNISVALGKSGIAGTLQFSERLLSGSQRGRSSGRGLRYWPTYPHLIRHLDRRTGTRAGPHSSVHREILVEMPSPIRLTPSLRERVWGRTHLSPWYPDTAAPTGEAWFLTDRDPPLLVKWIFTSERLSVQVHPDDGEDGPRGKTEMWHILEADPGATIAMGFREPITRERLWEATRTGEVEDLLRWVPVKPGETYFIPAHTVHAIGAGIVLCEIQQNSDVTYRLWDYGRPRELHVEKAVPLCELGVHPGASVPRAMGAGREELVRSKKFVTERVQLPAGATFGATPLPCHLWIPIEGSGTIGGEAYRAGEVWLVPEQAAIKAEAASRFLRTWAPADSSGSSAWAAVGRGARFSDATARRAEIRFVSAFFVVSEGARAARNAIAGAESCRCR